MKFKCDSEIDRLRVTLKWISSKLKPISVLLFIISLGRNCKHLDMLKIVNQLERIMRLD